MKATEIRIGNFFTTHIPIEGSWAERQRFKAQIYRVTCETFNPNNNFENLTRIPLTEEWLLKFGFKKSHDIEGYHNYEMKGFDMLADGCYACLAINGRGLAMDFFNL